jgi:hypothetical protein
VIAGITLCAFNPVLSLPYLDICIWHLEKGSLKKKKERHV